MLLQPAQREKLNAGVTVVPRQWECAVAPSRTWAAPRVLARDGGEGQTGRRGVGVDGKSRQRKVEAQGAVVKLCEKGRTQGESPVFTAGEGMSFVF